MLIDEPIFTIESSMLNLLSKVYKQLNMIIGIWFIAIFSWQYHEWEIANNASITYYIYHTKHSANYLGRYFFLNYNISNCLTCFFVCKIPDTVLKLGWGHGP